MPSPSEPNVLPVESPTSSPFQVLRTRIVAGLLAALPLALTIFIVRYLYMTVIAVLTPLIEAVRRYLTAREVSAEFWHTYLAPAVAVLLVLAFLYTLGLFVRTRLMAAFDSMIASLPIVGTIFKAVSNVSESLMQQLQGNRGFKRTVLVEFPHPGIKSLAFVTNTLRDAEGGRTVLCVCVLTGVMPPTGFTLFVPEESVIDVDWTMNQTLQAILSGGITTPKSIHYFGRSSPSPGSDGSLVDADGNPLGSGADDRAG